MVRMQPEMQNIQASIAQLQIFSSVYNPELRHKSKTMVSMLSAPFKNEMLCQCHILNWHCRINIISKKKYL